MRQYDSGFSQIFEDNDAESSNYRHGFKNLSQTSLAKVAAKFVNSQATNVLLSFLDRSEILRMQLVNNTW